MNERRSEVPALQKGGLHKIRSYEARGLFRDYYFDEPAFIEEGREVENGFEEIDGSYIETLRVYLCTKP